MLGRVWHGSEQRLCVGMAGAVAHLPGRPGFHQPPVVEHHDIARDVPDHGQIVGDEQVTDAEFALETCETRNDLIARRPLARLAAPDEIARAITYLASPAAAYLTGTDLLIDGGMTGLRAR